MSKIKAMAAILGLLLLAAGGVRAEPSVEEAVKGLQAEWAQIKYQTAKEKQADAFGQLADEARKVSAAYPERAEALIWEAIILSTYAGAKGGLGALSAVKEAQELLLKAMEIDSGALDGSAFTSLGSLYYQVPGWPISFGDDDKAREYLEKALAINPNGIDPNFFYGDFLMEQGEYAKAAQFLNKALNAPPRLGREAADAGRREEILALLISARKKL